RRHGLSEHIPAEQRPVVFIGPYEHHSNELPWRESIADVITIGEDADGRIDLDQLEAQLVAHAARPLKIGSFSAASNVTGVGTDAYVNPEEHRYLADPEHREEGGTPAIIESIRAGLVFQLKEAVGWQTIREREESFIDRAIASWSQHPNIGILGNRDAWRLS